MAIRSDKVARMSPMRRRSALASCLLLCLAGLAATPAQALDPREALTQFGLDVWQRRQGLPQSTVTAIAQTEDGYIWLGTQEGLVRFDGVRFTVFDRKNTPALTRHHITCLLASRDGGLWIGTLGGGLVRYENGRFLGSETRAALPEEIVSALMEDRDGQLWIGTFSKGLVRLRKGSLFPLTTGDGLSNNEVRALYQDRNGAVWIGTRGGGVNRYDNGVLHGLDDEGGAFERPGHGDPRRCVGRHLDRHAGRRQQDGRRPDHGLRFERRARQRRRHRSRVGPRRQHVGRHGRAAACTAIRAAGSPRCPRRTASRATWCRPFSRTGTAASGSELRAA